VKKSKLTFASKVSPAKMALRRHLSQERLTTPQPSVLEHPGPDSKLHLHQQHLHQRQPSRLESSRLLGTGSGSGSGSSSSSSSGSGGGGSGLLGTRTIGDLVSGEIERTLEISNQTIINAAVDMSVMARPDNSYSPISRPASAEGETGLATLAHVASYAPTPSAPPAASPSSCPPTRSSVLYTPQQGQAQRSAHVIVARSYARSRIGRASVAHRSL
jgi:hypothetical protein